MYFEYIEESIELIEQYLRAGSNELDRTRFQADMLTRDAVLHRVETLTEATSHLSPELRARHPDIDWRKIIGFRNVLAHGYIEANLDPLWQTITENLPALKRVIDGKRG